MKKQKIENSAFRKAVCSDLKKHQTAGKKYNDQVIFEESLKYLENNLEYNSLEEVDKMIQVRISKTQNWFQSNKHVTNMDDHYSEVEIYALRRFKGKIYQQLG